MHRLPRIRGHGRRRDRQIKLVKGGANIGWGGERGPCDPVAIARELVFYKTDKGACSNHISLSIKVVIISH